ncbi:MAG TPA: outer membrane beta-barrel protein [Bacteroidota bacterium]|nr:outer membrane beta-barrel protein [Bacteroidota bacterium]
MKRLPAIITAAVLLLLVTGGTARAQYLVGRWALGIEGGANYWITDYDEYKFGFGGQLTARYEIARYFGLGIVGGYEVLKTNQSVPLNPGAYASYIKANAIPVSVVAFIHFYPRKTVNPYVYIGGGMLMYQRFGIGTAAPVDGAWHTSYVIPAGFGIESFLNNDISITGSVGFANIGNDVDARTTSAFKGYATARIGLCFYLNEGPPHRPPPRPAGPRS